MPTPIPIQRLDVPEIGRETMARRERESRGYADQLSAQTRECECVRGIGVEVHERSVRWPRDAGMLVVACSQTRGTGWRMWR